MHVMSCASQVQGTCAHITDFIAILSNVAEPSIKVNRAERMLVESMAWRAENKVENSCSTEFVFVPTGLTSYSS